MEKINRIRKTLIFFILLFIITTILTLLMTSLFNEINSKIYSSAYTTREINKYPCLIKGNICSNDDIERAIKVKIQVSDNNSYDFYLLSNNEEYATFIMASNIEENVDWHSERVNIKGPINVFTELINLTKDWNKVPTIQSYNYKDEGLEYFKRLCSVDFGEDPDLYYDCTNRIIPTRGYNGLSIINGKTTIYLNLPEDDSDNYLISKEYSIEGNTRARLPEKIELERYYLNDLSLPDWLIDNTKENSGYWTMSSSTNPTIEYMQGAYIVANKENKAHLFESFTTTKDNYRFKNIGIRPVITIPKKEQDVYYN